MRNIDQTSADLFDKLRNRFSPIEIRDENREKTLNPDKARFFSFDYVSQGDNFGPMTISLLDKSMKIFYSQDIVVKMNPGQKKQWYKFLRDLRFFAMPEVKDFDVRDISKSGLNLHDLKFLNKDSDVYTKDEIKVSESKLYGTRKTSYQKLENVRIIARHNKPIVDETIPGARSRNIESFYIENSQGERFKLPEGTTINGARAYARHIKNGGDLHDDFSKHIGRMIKEMADLRMFVRNMRGRTFEDIQTQQMVESAMDHYGKLHSDLHLIRSQRGYDQYKSLWQPDMLEEDYYDLAELRERFVRKVFDERIDDALPVVFREYRRRKMATEQEFESWASEMVREFEEKNPTDRHNKKAAQEQQDLEEEDSSEINVKSPFANSARNQERDSVDNIIDDGDENQSLAGLLNEKGFEFRFSDGVYYFESKDEIERAKDWISYRFPKMKFPRMGVFDYGYGVYGSDTFDRELPGGKGVMESINENLRKWFQQDWVRFGPDGKIRGQCARDDDSEGKPKCLPRSKAQALGKKGRAKAARRKRRLDPNPERKGAAINVKTKEAVEFNVYLNELLKESIQYPLPSDIDKIPELPDYDAYDPVADSKDIFYFIDNEKEENEDDEIKEVTGDPKFDTMMSNILKGTAARKDVDALKAQPTKASPEAMLGKFGSELILQLEKLCQARCGPDRTMQDKPDIEPKLTAMANSNDGGEKVANVLLDLFKIDSNALKEFATIFNQYGDWPWQNFATAWTQGQWNDYKRQWTDGYLGSLGQGVAEAVHPDIFDKNISKEPTEKVRMGDFEFSARVFNGRIRGYGEPNDKGLYITAYDPKSQNVIGWAHFVVKSDEKGNQWLESADTQVDDDYVGRGVAAMMYAFAKSLGNDIKPSPHQSTFGKWMWKKWGKDAQHLMGAQGVAEGKQSCPECGGALVEFSQLNEKKDACYYKVKATAKVWPSAYASGRLVQCRKKGAKNWGKKNESTQPSVNKLLNSFKSGLDKL